jgi:SAM-dependent methyltransferase
MMPASQHERLLDKIRDSLRCPACHHLVRWVSGTSEISCNACGLSYPVLPEGPPILLVPEQRERFSRILHEASGGRQMVKEYRCRNTWRTRLRSALKPPSIVYDEDVARRFSWIYDTRGLETLVLSIGGGPGRESPRVINLNIDAFDDVDLVGDGTNLPLMDSCLDTVTCNAVIEHVPDPAVLISEIYRVLKPGGYVQFMVPFIFPFHEYPADYQRYTASGLRQIAAGFEEVELCILTGPTSALLVFIREYLRLLVPGGNSRITRTLLNGVSGWLVFPLKYLDRFLNRKPEAEHLAAAFYYVGRKPLGGVAHDG